MTNIEEAKARLKETANDEWNSVTFPRNDRVWSIRRSDLRAVLDRLDEAESELLEQARLNGMGSEREAKLRSRLDAMDALARELVDGLKVEIAVDENNHGKASESDYRLLDRARALLGGEAR